MVNAPAGTTDAPTAIATPQCELHVFPTENYLGMNSGLLSGLGLLGAVADVEAHKGRVQTVTGLMKDYLGPDIQVEELNKLGIAKLLKLSSEYRIVVEPPTPSAEAVKADPALKEKVKALNADLKAGKRISASTAPCYSELVIMNIFYMRAMMYGSNLFVPMQYRDFGTGLAKPVVSMGAVKNPLENFPPRTPEMIEAAKVEIRDAFAKDMVEWSQKKLAETTAVAAK